MRKTSEWKQRARHSPGALGFLGGILGAGAGVAIASLAGRRREEAIDYGAADRYPSTEEGRWTEAEKAEGLEGDSHERMADLRSRAAQEKEQLRQKAHGAMDTVRGKADELREKAGGKAGELRGRASELRHRAPSGGQIKGSASGYFHRAVNEQPILLGLGTVLLGLIAGQLIPAGEREHRAMGPIKERVRDQVREVQERVDEKISQAGSADEEEAEARGTGVSDMPPPLH